MSTPEKSVKELTVKVTLPPHSGQSVPPARVYLFDESGALAHSAPVSGTAAALTISPERRYRLVVGPDLPTHAGASSQLAADLAKAGAISRDVIPKVTPHELHIMIPQGIYHCWSKTCILVHGSVRKQTAPGIYAPICGGIVQIFEVDLGCTLDRLASFTDAPLVFALLADKMIGLEAAVLSDRLALIPNLPDPPPDFGATRAIGDRVVAKSSDRVLMDSSDGVLMDRSDGVATQQVTLQASGGSTSKRAAKAATAAELGTSLKALPAHAMKNAILANKDLLWPYFCGLIPDEWFCWQHLGDATIQSDGSFSAEVCFWCPDDFPDLYFEVVQTVDGIEREISDPQIACSTYYDYDGSESVDITVDDPNAIACAQVGPSPISGDDYYVWPNFIGNTDLRAINGLESPAGGAGQGLLGTVPWGGTLALKMVFDPRLRTDGVAHYYRWSYLFDGDTLYSPFNAPVVKRYFTWSFPNMTTHNYPLGPHTVGGRDGLYEIPPAIMGDGWVTGNDPVDNPFGYFDSTDNHAAPWTVGDKLPRRSGMCTLLLELFDSSGNPIPSGNISAGDFVFVLPDLTAGPDVYTSVLGPNNITPAGNLMFRVLIDNNDTVATLDGVTAGSAAADDCGILHYADGDTDVDIAFHATHPHDYLTWDLYVYRGSHGSVAATSGTSSSPPAGSNPFENDAADLLGGCINAAFAVNLNTGATATDGYGRQTQYDRSATIAFALLNP